MLIFCFAFITQQKAAATDPRARDGLLSMGANIRLELQAHAGI